MAEKRHSVFSEKNSILSISFKVNHVSQARGQIRRANSGTQVNKDHQESRIDNSKRSIGLSFLACILVIVLFFAGLGFIISAVINSSSYKGISEKGK